MAEMKIDVTADTGQIVQKARIIAKHLTALADELEAPDSIITVPGELTEEQARAFVDDREFERRLQHLMRIHPQVLETWIRKRERIRGRPLGQI